ncbi:hypothetical protein [Pelagibius sp. Alg239-R121]|uniref:hypothetical protein n=1 Tax=Pelagibius sp. Alg239-R121 TaxID=2993448 RepID=UPI0024A6FCF3|nr:hypothetical protein [Pelagibius sp. Alg239-R121]
MKTAIDTYLIVFDRVRFIPAALLLPGGFALLYLLLEFVHWLIQQDSTGIYYTEYADVISHLSIVAYALIYITFAVNWHCIVLYDLDAGIGSLPKFLTRVHLKYFTAWLSGVVIPSAVLWALSWACLCMLYLFLLMLDYQPGTSPLDVLPAGEEGDDGSSSWLRGRMSFSFPDYIPLFAIFIGPGLAWRGFFLPADATGSKYTHRENSHDRHGQFLSRLTSYYLTTSPLILLCSLYNLFIYDMDYVLEFEFLEVSVIETFLRFLFLMFVTTFISVAFKTTTGWTPELSEASEDEKQQ